MPDSLIIQNSVTIDATPAIVWNALVNPEQTRQYMFGCEAVSDWTVGSPLLWRGLHEGREMVFVEGTITALDPETFLAYTAIDPHAASPDSPANCLLITYALSAENGKTNLTVTQGDYATVTDGPRRYREAMDAGGWGSILLDIKALIEDRKVE
jgi:uncharacterized protein YndB with AHSA1/START domain